MLDIVFDIGFSAVVISTCIAVAMDMLSIAFTTMKKTFFKKDEK